MKRKVLSMLAVCAALTSVTHAQSSQRQATMRGGGDPNRGKCTIEVVVDSVAQVEIRGASATLRTVSGQPAQWRRFECSGVMPANPGNFSFAGVDGRGRQTLVRDPRNGGVAVVEIEDKDSGSEGYTFDIVWDSRPSGPQYNSNPGPPPGNPQDYRDNNGRNNNARENNPADRGGPPDQYRPHYRDNYRDSDYFRRYGHGFPADEAVRICQQEIVRQAGERFRGSDIHFERTMVDNTPGREDWVTGSIDVHRGPRGEAYGFSCSMDFDAGRLRNAQIELRPMR
jgi:hypothetical protein